MLAGPSPRAPNPTTTHLMDTARCWYEGGPFDSLVAGSVFLHSSLEKLPLPARGVSAWSDGGPCLFSPPLSMVILVLWLGLGIFVMASW